MIVDDNETIVELLGDIFRVEGFEVVEALSGNECLEKVNESVDLILLDITMPGMDGWVVVKRLREMALEHGPKVLLLSALQESEVRVDPDDTLVKGYIKKPFKPEQMLKRIRNVLDNAP